MARPMQQTISCPNCRQPFHAILEQIIDVGVDPTAKERLLSGRINLVSCPHCGFQGMASMPIMYHDPEKQLALVYVPMELNMSKEERERLIGNMTNTVMRSLPENAPRGYLLQPGTPLTLQGLIDTVLEAEGITREMIDTQQRQVDLINRLATASNTEEANRLMEENLDLVDATFLQLLSVAAQQASQAGQARTSLRLLNIRSRLMETTEAGRELKAREDAIAEANEELRALGSEITREKFVDLVVNAAGNQPKLEALAALGAPLLDYLTFEILTDRIEQAEGERAEQLKQARALLQEVGNEYRRQTQAAYEQARQTLNKLVSADNLDEAILQNSRGINDTFMSVLQSELELARQNGQLDRSTRLKDIRDRVLSLLEQSTSVQLIELLLQAESDEQARALLREQPGLLTPQFLATLRAVTKQLHEAGQERQAARLEAVEAEATELIKQAAPPEIRLINDLLSAQSMDEARQILRERSDELSPELVELMQELSAQIREAGNTPVAERLDAIRMEVQTLV